MVAHTNDAPTSVGREVPLMAGEGWFGHVGPFRDDPLGLVTRALRAGDDLVRMRIAVAQAFVVFGPDLVRQVLVEHPERFGRQSRGAKLLRRTLGTSTLTAEGDEWRWRRRLVQPSFKRSALDLLDRPIVAAAAALGDMLAARTEPVDVSELTSALALSIACTALFGGDLAEDGEVVHRALDEVLREFLQFTLSPIPNIDQLPLPTARRFRSARADLTGVVERIVARRRAREEPVGDLLDALLAGTRPDGTPLTAADLDAEGVTMLLAGHETTANAMAFALGLLGRTPAVRRRLRAELDEVLGDRDPTAADLERLPFLDAVVKETLRLYPPAWILSRSTAEAVSIGGYDLPRGAFLFVPIYAVHRHPRYWDDPEGFDPDRWLDGRGEAARKAGAYLPFGLGQRRCVGEHLGTLEARLVLATLARRVHLSLEPGQGLDLELSVTLRPRGGLWMTPRPA
ncbi:MAG: cytochrome P450 [Myxococcota bacterium]